MFQISEQYLPYEEGTLIVVMSGSQARIFSANGRSLEEKKILKGEEVIDVREHQQYADAHTEEAEQNSRLALYKTVGAYLAHEKPKNLIICAPEIYQREVKEALTKEQQGCIAQFLPKNLASLPVEAIIRILQER